MSAIVIQPNTRSSRVVAAPEDFMPLSTRMFVAQRLNQLWAEFVNEMHDGATIGSGVAQKFWLYVITSGG
jgi:hypothetical protein